MTGSDADYESANRRYEVRCEECLLENEWRREKGARLQYELHEDHRGSEFTRWTRHDGR